VYNLTYSDSAVKYIRTNVPEKHLKNLGDGIELCLGKYLKTIFKRCNKKEIKGTNPVTYRLHISMRYTVFYIIDDENKEVYITEIMGINQDHSKYGLQ